MSKTAQTIIKVYLIYMFTSPSGKSYIGQTFNLEKRKKTHQLKDSH
jgi:predicted GIY-YIG superfamily endonuclease